MTNINEFQQGKKLKVLPCKSVDCKTTNSNNKKYLDFTLADKTGEINVSSGRYQEEEKRYSANTLIKVRVSFHKIPCN